MYKRQALIDFNFHGLKTIGVKSFSNSGITSVHIDVYKRQTRGCFYNNVSLTKFDFSNIPGIDEAAFSKSGLIKIQLDKKVERIEKGAFSNCKKLSNVIWNCPQSVSYTHLDVYKRQHIYHITLCFGVVLKLRVVKLKQSLYNIK